MAGDQYAARHDSDVAGARNCRPSGALVRRFAELDGGGRFVSALRWRQGTGMRGQRPAFLGPSFLFGHFVLTRWLRRLVRVLCRLGRRELTSPRYSVTMLSAALL